VAEIGSAFLCVKVGVMAEPREDHAHYLKSWIGDLKADNRAIFTAASAAQKAAGLPAGLAAVLTAGMAVGRPDLTLLCMDRNCRVLARRRLDGWELKPDTGLHHDSAGGRLLATPVRQVAWLPAG
jgi:hypothetical protein